MKMKGEDGEMMGNEVEKGELGRKKGGNARK